MNIFTNKRGFTLIEVLLALSIIAISLTALLRATSQTTLFTQRIKEKSSAHWVAMQVLTSIQTGFIKASSNEVIDNSSQIFNTTWYWHAKISNTPIKNMEQITINIGKQPHADYIYTLSGYRYINE